MYIEEYKFVHRKIISGIALLNIIKKLMLKGKL